MICLSTLVGQSIDGIPPQGGCGHAGALVVALRTLGDHFDTGTG